MLIVEPVHLYRVGFMNLRLFKLIVGILITLLGTNSSAALLSVKLSTSGFGLIVDILAPAGPSPQTGTSFDFCVYNGAEGGTCGTGLQIEMDVSDSAVGFKFTGTTGLPAAAAGGSFKLTLSDFVFDVPATVTGIMNVDPMLATGSFQASGMNPFVFDGDDLGDPVSGISTDATDPAGVTLSASFPLQVQVPAPNILALFGLGLAAMGYARRRRSAGYA